MHARDRWALGMNAVCDSAGRARGLHAVFAALTVTALVTGFSAFNWRAPIPGPLRESLFIMHRWAGFGALVLLLLWVLRRGIAWRPRAHADEAQLAALAQNALAALGILMASMGWLARAQDGRWLELISPLPIHNLVSRPDTWLAHQLYYLHALIAKVLVATIMAHALMAAWHRVGTMLTRVDGRTRE